jgi:hypothetical protein
VAGCEQSSRLGLKMKSTQQMLTTIKATSLGEGDPIGTVSCPRTEGPA